MKLNLFKENVLEEEENRERILKSAWIALQKYKEYIEKSIKVVQRQGTIKLSVTRYFIEKEDGNKDIAWKLNLEELKEKEFKRAENELFSREIEYIYLEEPEDKKAKKVKIIDRNAEENYLILDVDADQVIEALYLKANDYQLKRQLQAVYKLIYSPNKQVNPILQLFNSSRFAAKFFAKNIDESINESDIAWKILKDEQRDGNDQQRSFVYKALRTNDFALLEGPPGSGKTTAIIELILQLIDQGKRVLLVSATHVAVDNVIHRILTSYKKECEGKVVPLRIGDKGNIRKESVKPYRLQDFIPKKKREIKNQIRKKKNKSESQQRLFKYLKDDEKKNQEFDDIILKSANLVGGTMIGVLQHPDIKKQSSNEIFDVMIVDESSKVTFLDFLVPAMYAKKWILVGDIKQLSPYVEDDYVNETIDQLIPAKRDKQMIVDQFEFRRDLMRSKGKPWGNYLKVFFTEDVNHSSFEDLEEDYEGEFVIVADNFDPSLRNIAALNGAKVLICKKSPKVKALLAKHLFVKTKFFEGSIGGAPFKNRQKYFHRNRNKETKSFNYYYHRFEIVEDKKQEWKELVGSRLGQFYECRYNEQSVVAEEIKMALDILVPTKYRQDLDSIRKVALPSILELLQIGIGKTKSKQGYVQRNMIYEGFKKFDRAGGVYDLKFQSLEYQHRMNDAIAATSREFFYENNLKTANKVYKRANPLKGYKASEEEVIWVENANRDFRKKDKDGKSRNINSDETSHIENELKAFIKFAEMTPQKNEAKEEVPYELAVLTFYRHQETELKTMLRNLTKQHHKHKFFTKGNVKITLCTVDKFQGDEADMVLLSFAIFKPRAFYNNSNRLNVALTRARYKLILYGNRGWLAKRAVSPALQHLANEYDKRIDSGTNNKNQRKNKKKR